jgi:hypothetical protein
MVQYLNSYSIDIRMLYGFQVIEYIATVLCFDFFYRSNDGYYPIAVLATKIYSLFFYILIHIKYLLTYIRNF